MNRVQPDTTAIRAKPYKIYVGLITQSGTAAPTVEILQNTLPGNIEWTYFEAGGYLGELTGAFTANKTWITVQPLYGIASVARSDDNIISISTLDSGTGDPTNGFLYKSPIEIRVYE